jgi:hypothetical protein
MVYWLLVNCAYLWVKDKKFDVELLYSYNLKTHLFGGYIYYSLFYFIIINENGFLPLDSEKKTLLDQS